MEEGRNSGLLFCCYTSTPSLSLSLFLPKLTHLHSWIFHVNVAISHCEYQYFTRYQIVISNKYISIKHTQHYYIVTLTQHIVLVGAIHRTENYSLGYKWQYFIFIS